MSPILNNLTLSSFLSLTCPWASMGVLRCACQHEEKMQNKTCKHSFFLYFYLSRDKTVSQQLKGSHVTNSSIDERAEKLTEINLLHFFFIFRHLLLFSFYT